MYKYKRLCKYLKRTEKFSGTKRSSKDADDKNSKQEENEDNKPEESPVSYKRTKNIESEDLKERNIDLKLKQLSDRKSSKESEEKKKIASRLFNFVSVLHKAKSNLATEK